MQSGSFRLIREDASGWMRHSDMSELPTDVETAFIEWGLFEIREHCLEQAKDCGILVKRNGPAILAMRVKPGLLSLYRLPAKAVVENGVAAALDFAFPMLLGTLDESNGTTEAHIDAWFASLDKGEVPIETVQVPVLAIGEIRVWVDSAVLGN